MEANGLLTVAQRHIPGGKQRKASTHSLNRVRRSESLRDRILSEQVQHNGQGVALRTLVDIAPTDVRTPFSSG